MNNLINIENQDGTLLVSSREVAENFEKRHDSVLRDVTNLIENVGSPQNCGSLFNVTTYTHKQNKQEYKEVLMNRDGFTLLAMGFTGRKALEWKLKYIEAFNKMEKELSKPKPLTTREELKLHYQAMEEIDGEISDIRNTVTEMQDNMPLFNIECKELQALVRKVGVRTLGGYKSPAYDDNSTRGKVYADIQSQLKREFGVTRYEAIKRVQLEQAKEIVANYKTPLILQEEIQIANKQMRLVEGKRSISK